MIQIHPSFTEEFSPNEQLVMLQLLLLADSDGMAPFNEREVSRKTGVPYQQVRTIHRRFVKRGILSPDVGTKRKMYVSICENDAYRLSARRKNTATEEGLLKKRQEEMKKRREAFTESMKPYVEQYGKDMLNNFWRYWTEPNKSQTKMRYEMQKTWDLRGRLITWEKNNNGKFKQ